MDISKQFRESALGTKASLPFAIIFTDSLKEKRKKSFRCFYMLLISIIMLSGFLDVTVMRKSNQLVTDLYLKPHNMDQYLHVKFCHIYHCKKSIPFSRTLHLNRICPENSFWTNAAMN